MPYERTFCQRIRTFVWLVTHPTGTDNPRGAFKIKKRMSIKTVREIVTEYLEANGFDGLYDPEYDCSCGIDRICGGDTGCMTCIPGHAITLPDGARGIGEKPEE